MESISIKKIELTRIAGHTFIAGLITNNSKVLDCGANRGEFSLEVIKRWGCEVHAVEPNPVLASFLKENADIKVYEAALSQNGLEHLFKIDKNNSEASTIVKSKDHGVIKVRGMKIDDLLEKIHGVDLMKMDIEGSEIEILNSVSEKLIKQVPQISVEFHDFMKGSEITSEMVSLVCERMRGMGFEKFVMSYWTHGDVLFINKRCVHLNFLKNAIIQIKGRWIPGVSRYLKRLW